MCQIAVFARNHESYLKEACKDPSKPVTFQSHRRWVSARKAWNKQKTLKIYFAAIGSQAKIRYEATIQEIETDPNADASLLEFRLPCTVDEGLWGKTLYSISNCQPCPERNLSTLQKRDGTLLSDNFGYSYALVQETIDTVVCHPEGDSSGDDLRAVSPASRRHL